MTWSADGQDLIVSLGNVGNDVGVWRIPANGSGPGTPVVVVGRRNPVRRPSPHSRTGWRTRGPHWMRTSGNCRWRRPGRPDGAPVMAIASTRLDRNAQFSSDGTRIAFESVRSGVQEIWVVDPDGATPSSDRFQWPAGGTPGWSPDGEWIAYDLRAAVQETSIWSPQEAALPAADEASKRRSHPELVARRALDLLRLEAHGTYQVWKVSPQRRGAVQVTTRKAAPMPRSRGTGSSWTTRVRTDAPFALACPDVRGAPVQVLSRMGRYGNFAVTRDGIYFEATSPCRVSLLDSFYTHVSRHGRPLTSSVSRPGKSTTVVTLPRSAGTGLDVSRDGRTLLFVQTDAFVEDLMLVENFR